MQLWELKSLMVFHLQIVGLRSQSQAERLRTRRAHDQGQEKRTDAQAESKFALLFCSSL
jgi:hypothetical protein